MAGTSRVRCNGRCDSGSVHTLLDRLAVSSIACVDKQAQMGINVVTHPELRLRARSRRKAASAYVLAEAR